MDGIINLLFLALEITIAGYLGYCLGHINGFREGMKLQRKIYRDEL